MLFAAPVAHQVLHILLFLVDMSLFSSCLDTVCQKSLTSPSPVRFPRAAKPLPSPWSFCLTIGRPVGDSSATNDKMTRSATFIATMGEQRRPERLPALQPRTSWRRVAASRLFSSGTVALTLAV